MEVIQSFDLRFHSFPHEQNQNYCDYNTNVIPFEKHLLYSVSFILAFKQDEIMPGNGDQAPSQHKNTGRNHPWVNLWKGGCATFTKIILWNSETDEFDLMNINNKMGYYHYLLCAGNTSSIGESDMRLYSQNGKIFLHSRDLRNFFELEIDIPRKEINILKNVGLTNKFGHNFVILNYDSESDDLEFIDWWRFSDGKKNLKKGLYIRKSEAQEMGLAFHSRVIEFKRPLETGFSGAGSFLSRKQEDMDLFGKNYGIAPSICNGAGCKFPKISSDEEIVLNVCHFKIYCDSNTYPYRKNSNVEKFREDFLQQFQDYFGERFTAHFGTYFVNSAGQIQPLGYIYLAAFCLIKRINGQIIDIKFSDPFFPIELNSTCKRESTVVFPMGICPIPDSTGLNLLVTFGKDDFRSGYMKFNSAEVIRSCIHDGLDFDMEKMKYWIFATDQNGKFLKGNSLDEIIRQVS